MEDSDADLQSQHLSLEVSRTELLAQQFHIMRPPDRRGYAKHESKRFWLDVNLAPNAPFWTVCLSAFHLPMTLIPVVSNVKGSL